VCEVTAIAAVVMGWFMRSARRDSPPPFAGATVWSTAAARGEAVCFTLFPGARLAQLWAGERAKATLAQILRHPLGSDDGFLSTAPAFEVGHCPVCYIGLGRSSVRARKLLRAKQGEARARWAIL